MAALIKREIVNFFFGLPNRWDWSFPIGLLLLLLLWCGLLAYGLDAEAVDVGVPLAVELARLDVELHRAGGSERDFGCRFEVGVEERYGNGLWVLFLGFEYGYGFAPGAFC